MAASQAANFNLQEFTDVGQLLVGGRLYTYAYGTTAQKIAFTDPDGTVPHTYTLDGAGGQYIALNARGELPAPLYLVDGSYDISLKRVDGSTVWTRKADGVEATANAVVSALQLTDYVALRAYKGSQKNVYVTGYLAAKAPSGIAGAFVRDDSDKVSADNGGTIIVSNGGIRWKRVFRGAANVVWFGAAADWDGNTGTDDTAAVQAALNAHAKLYVPAACRVTHDLYMNTPYASLSGGGMFSGSAIVRTGPGAGTILTCGANTQYPRVEDMCVRWVPWTVTDYFNTGSVAIDTTAGNSSIKLYNAWLRGCQKLVKGAYNSFYNKAIGCRFEEFQDGFYQFSVNNLLVDQCRFKNFNTAFTVNGNGGPTNIVHNSFEVFNGALVSSTGDQKGLVNFKRNYVEIYDNENLPTNFPQAANGKAGKFGGQVLFSGPYGTLNICDNDLSLGGVLIIAGPSACDHFVSVRNTLHLYAANNNLLRLHNLPTLKSCTVRDRIGDTIGPDGGYVRIYDQPANIPLLDSPYGDFEFYDAILGKFMLCPSRLYSPALINGWTNGDSPDGVPALLYTKEGLFLQGEATGTARTAEAMLTLPPDKRPLELGTSRAFCFLTTTSDQGAGGVVQLRYLYNSGDLRLENVPVSASKICLDGLFIPARI